MVATSARCLLCVIAGSLMASSAQAGHLSNLRGAGSSFMRSTFAKVQSHVPSQTTQKVSALAGKMKSLVPTQSSAPQVRQTLINDVSTAPPDSVLLPYFEVDVNKPGSFGVGTDVTGTPAPTTPATPPAPAGNGGMTSGGGRGSWIPAAIGAVVQAGVSARNSAPVYQTPVYQQPVYQAPVQYAAPAQYAAPVPAAAPQLVSLQSLVTSPAAGSTGGLVISAIEPLATAPGQLLVRGAGFGTQPGRMVLDINGVRLSLEVVNWTANAVVVKLPSLQAAANATVAFTAVRVDGAASQPFNPTSGAAAAN